MRPPRQYLDTAALLALRGAGRVEPNPLVGCILVSPEGRIVGAGHHRRFGAAHAERDAIESARRQGNDPAGSTAFVTLEPCNAQGKQPPCVEALIQARIAAVVYAQVDPNPAKSGGAAALCAAGIPAVLSHDSPFATAISAPFIKRAVHSMPWVVAKWAQTIDGRVATRSGASKWISNERSRRRVHLLRSRVDAILTGIGTVHADDPLLTARDVPVRRLASRVVVDSELDIPLNSALVRTAASVPTIIACAAELADSSVSRAKCDQLRAAHVQIIGVPSSASGRGLDIEQLLKTLWTRLGFATIMLESGPGLLGSMLDADLIDEAVVYIAPLLLGDELARSVAVGRLAESLAAARSFTLHRVRQLGSDVELTYVRPGALRGPHGTLPKPL